MPGVFSGQIPCLVGCQSITIVRPMPSSLTIDDFRPLNVTCELRYENAYLIYDQTGQILEDLREGFTNIKVSVASPPQTDFIADEGQLEPRNSDLPTN